MKQQIKFPANQLRLRVLATMPPRGGRPVLARPGVAERLVALSIDDGPSAANTVPLLELLESRGASATFFVVGQELDARPEIARRTVEGGHELGNHTYSHQLPEGLSDDQVREELVRGTDAIERAAGVTPRLMRPPFGRELRRFQETGNELGLQTVMWSLDSGDTWGHPAERVGRSMARARRGDIVLLHDGHDYRPATLGGTERALDALAARGFRCVTVSKLLAAG